MERQEALVLLKYHAFAHDDVNHPKMQHGFLGSLRPFRGQLIEENFHELMRILRVFSTDLSNAALDREVMACLWSITHLARAWAVEPEGMLRSNHLISDEQVAVMEEWLNLFSYAVMILIEGGDEQEAFWGYEQYVLDRSAEKGEGDGDMKSGGNTVINDLRIELNHLLDRKIKDEEIRSLYDTYLQLAGVSETELDQFEKQYGVRLPVDFRAFYRHTDGSGYGLHMLYPGDVEQGSCQPFYLMSLDEIVETKQYFCDVDEKLEEHYGDEEIRQLDPEIKPYLFHKSWIPFATMAGGSLYLMFDFDPAEAGTYGQIIMYVHDPDFVYYVTSSFTELLRMSIRNLNLMDEIEY